MKYKLIGECRLPIKFNEEITVDVAIFNGGKKKEEVVALIHKGKGYHSNSIPLVRVHSACLTGEVFGSQKCDCGYQFKTGMETICNSPYGIMLYMASHEGRGIGLGNKIRAYQLQEKGADTLEANIMLGFSADARDFTLAAEVLKHLKATKVKLITNNPDKILSLQKEGIEVIEQINLSAYLNKFNESYLYLKKHILKHKFRSFLPERGKLAS